MKRCSIFALLIFVGTLTAQPWQWQRLQSDFYNPTNFPERNHWYNRYAMIAIGDFNGDGRAEFYDVTETSFRVAVRDPDRFHWTTSEYSGQGRPGVTGLWAADLDHDGSDELVIYEDSVTVLKATAYTPWTWTRRNDLLAGLFLPPHLQKAIFGDYDGDGLLNAVCWSRLDTDRVDMLHRTVDGVWHLDSTLHFWSDPNGIVDIFDGDFNHDGRLDFGVDYISVAYDENDALTFFENTGSGSSRHDFCGGCSTFDGGGDLDGDGQWEELERDFYAGYGTTTRRAGYYLRHTAAADSGRFIRFTDESYLGHFAGSVLGNFRTPSGPEIVGIFNRFYDEADMIYYECELESFSPTGWRGSNTLHTYYGFFASDFFFSMSAGDLDGDGRKDIVGIHGKEGYGDLLVFRNNGTDSVDSFDRGARAVLRSQFPENADTVFSSPQVGNVTGDNRAELAMLAQPHGGASEVQFYEKLGPAIDSTYVLHPEWSAGLPENLLTIRLADLDNDGTCELLGKMSGADTSGHWEAYFFRGGLWTHFENILPDFSAPDISFADVNADGNLDLLTPTEVWINQSPSKANDPFTLAPSSFTLSAYPNPFNPVTTISYDLPKAGNISLRVFDLLGREVAVLKDGFAEAGSHRVAFNGGRLASGVYFARLDAGKFSQTKKLVLMK